MKKLDVLFVIPGNLGQVYQNLAAEHAIEPPAMARWIASYLMRRGCSVEAIDVVADHLGDDAVAQQVQDFNPHLVVVPVYGSQPSASTQNMPAARAVCQAIKDRCPETPILMTGTHPAALPGRTLQDEPVDFVCSGEGPLTVHETLQALKAGDSVSKARGLWYRENGVAVKTSPAPLIQNLDEEPPMIGWMLFDPRKYYAHDWHTGYIDYRDRTPYASVITELGCPFGCSFCCIQAPFREGEAVLGTRNSYRCWSPKLVLEEIELLVMEYGVEHIKFPDETFVLKPNHVLGIADGIAERFGDTLNIWAYSRIDTMKPEFLSRLRRAGFKFVAFGIESAESKVRDGQDKGFSDAKIMETIRHTEEAGINVVGNYIFGLPGDTLDSMERTLAMAMSLNTAYANFYCVMAYPGSAFYLDAKRRGISLPDDAGGPGWIGYSQHAYETLPLSTETLSAAEVLRFRDAAWRRYNTNPAFLKKMERVLGKVAVKNIRRVTDLPPLKRRILGD